MANHIENCKKEKIKLEALLQELTDELKPLKAKWKELKAAGDKVAWKALNEEIEKLDKKKVAAKADWYALNAEIAELERLDAQA